MKALAGIGFTARLVADTTLDQLLHFERDPALVARHPPPCPYAAFHSLKILVGFGAGVVDKSDVLFGNLCRALRCFRRRWGCADHLLNRLEYFLAHRDDEPNNCLLEPYGHQCDPFRAWAWDDGYR